jgi:hypothetical protein
MILTGENGSTVQLQLSGIIGNASRPDTQKIPIFGFSFENRLHWWFKVEEIATNGLF